jgi:hypothetical protein
MNTVSDEDEFESPDKSDLLVRGDLPDWINNACVNIRQQGDGYAYMEGYRKGARILVEHVMESARNQDYLVYPIVFLYRHHFELCFKKNIRRASLLLDRALTQQQKKHLGEHNLQTLWQDLKPLLIDTCRHAGWTTPSANEIDGIDSYIRQLTDLDRDSYSFRYEVSKKQVPSLPKNLRRINLRHFAHMLEKLAYYFDGIDIGFSDLESHKDEEHSNSP